jgi:hypothetical protein
MSDYNAEVEFLRMLLATTSDPATQQTIQERLAKLPATPSTPPVSTGNQTNIGGDAAGPMFSGKFDGSVTQHQQTATTLSGIGVAGSVHGNVVQNYFGSQPPANAQELLNDYLHRVVRQCQELKLERLHERSGQDRPTTPPLTLNDVYAQLTTDGPRVLVGKMRQSTAQRIGQVFGRFSQRFECDPAAVAPDRVRVPWFEPSVGQAWFDPALPFRQYLTKLEQADQTKLQDLPDETLVRWSLARPELVSDVVRAHRRVVLLGEPGGGKSTVLRYLAIQAAQAALGQAPALLGTVAPPLPIFLALGQLDRALADLERRPVDVVLAALRTELETRSLTPGLSTQLDAALRRGGVWLLFDGLDELSAAPLPTQPTTSLRARAAQAIRDLDGLFSGQSRIIVTSRVTPYRQPGNWQLLEPGWVCRTLEPLAFGQVRTFVASWYAAVARTGTLSTAEANTADADLIAQLESSGMQAVRDLMQTPLLLTMLTIVHYNARQQQKRLPDQQSELYEKCVELLLHRWEPVRTFDMLHPGLLEQLQAPPGVQLSQIRELLHELAFRAHHRASDGSGRGRLTADELTGRLHTFFVRLNMPPDQSIQIFQNYINDKVGLLQR